MRAPNKTRSKEAVWGKTGEGEKKKTGREREREVEGKESQRGLVKRN